MTRGAARSSEQHAVTLEIHGGGISRTLGRGDESLLILPRHAPLEADLVANSQQTEEDQQQGDHYGAL